MKDINFEKFASLSTFRSALDLMYWFFSFDVLFFASQHDQGSLLIDAEVVTESLLCLWTQKVHELLSVRKLVSFCELAPGDTRQRILVYIELTEHLRCLFFLVVTLLLTLLHISEVVVLRGGVVSIFEHQLFCVPGNKRVRFDFMKEVYGSVRHGFCLFKL